MTEAQATRPESFPTQAQVVIVGGGVIGCSVACHLTKPGWRDVVLLERRDLTCGTTQHAAGLVVSETFTSAVMSDMSEYSLELYRMPILDDPARFAYYREEIWGS